MFKKILFICLLPLAAAAQEAIYDSYVLAPGWTKLSFIPPESGTYTLPTYPKATNGNVINHKSEVKSLYELYDNKITLLNFMYTTCTDINGCPLATAVFHKIQQKVSKDPELSKKLDYSV